MDNLGFKSDVLAAALTAGVCAAVGGGLLYVASTPSAAALPPAAQSTEVEVTALIFEAPSAPEVVPPEPKPPLPEEPEPEVIPEPEPEPEPVVELEPDPELEVAEEIPVVEKPKPEPKPEPKPKPNPKPKTKPLPAPPKPAPAGERSRGAAVQGSTNISGVTVPAVTAADTSAAEQQASYDRALAVLLREVSAHKSYPPRARRQGVEGRCVIRFTVNSSGVVTGSDLMESSGSSLLDAACRRTGESLIGRATGVTRAVNVNVPVQFKLTD